MKRIALFTLAIAALTLTACGETEEERLARETQFNGKTIAEVAARIGAPRQKSATQAVWVYSHTYTQTTPIYGVVNGQSQIVNYHSYRVTNSCTYTAALKRGRVQTSSYQGNSCRQFAPKLAT